MGAVWKGDGGEYAVGCGVGSAVLGLDVDDGVGYKFAVFVEDSPRVWRIGERGGRL